MSGPTPALLDRLRGRLIVSCQAQAGEPLAAPGILAAMAQAAVLGGAAGIRAEGPANLEAVRKAVDVPMIGLWKRDYPDSEVRITPTLAEALAVAATGCEIVALDATRRRRPGGEDLEAIVRELRARGDQLLLADVATFEEGVRAAALGFDWIGTTLSGYTAATARPGDAPDLALVKRLAEYFRGKMPILAEGRIATPGQAARALALGAFAVVVGSAITRPTQLTRGFVAAMQPARGE